MKTINPSLFLLCTALFVASTPQLAVASTMHQETPIKCSSIVKIKNSMSLSKSFAKTYAHSQMYKMGWSNGEWKSLLKLWTRESRWDPSAKNPHSTAFGIAQMLNTPHDSTIIEQVNSGLIYIKHRYKSPTMALKHHYRTGWY